MEANQPPLIARRGLAAEKICRCVLPPAVPTIRSPPTATLTERRLPSVATLAGPALPNLESAVPVDHRWWPQRDDLRGAFSAVGTQFVLVGRRQRLRPRCTATTAAPSALLNDPLVLSGSAIAGTTLSCSDRRSRVLVARATDFKLLASRLLADHGHGLPASTSPPGEII